MYWLRVIPPDGPPSEHALEDGDLVVGRSATCDLAVADPFLSRQHARIQRRGDEIRVEDLGSSNGTRVNGEPVAGKAPVRPGDLIQLCGTTLALHTGTESVLDRLDGLSGSTDQSIFLSASEVLAAQSRALAPDRGEEAVRRAAQRLRLMNEVHEALAGSIAHDELLEMILDRSFDHLEPEEGAIYLRSETGEAFDLAASRSLPGSDRPLLYSRSLIREVSDKGLAALVLDIETDERFSAVESMISSGVRSLVAAPLLTPAGSLGMIVLSSRLAERRFSQEDLELLISLASVAALRLRNMTLAREAAERRRLEEEMKLARQIQVALVPSALPAPESWELHAGTVPSRGVSGDFYIVLERPEREDLLLMVADVSGKGMAAALLMASLEALTAPPIAEGLPPDEILAVVSPLLFDRTPVAKFATAFLATLSPRTGRLRYASAGHNPAVVLGADGSTRELGATGRPLGLVAGSAYSGVDLELGPGDLLVAYSDGIVEAESPEGREYGLDRLVRLCRGHEGPLAELGGAIGIDLDDFCAGAPQSDDRTLLLLRRGSA